MANIIKRVVLVYLKIVCHLNLFNSDKLMFKLILISLMGVKSGENFQIHLL
jgi:hypothetical protein